MDQPTSFHERAVFMTLVRLLLGLLEVDIATRFGISQASVSQITNTWINLMYHNLKSIETFPPWHIVKKYMPEGFKKDILTQELSSMLLNSQLNVHLFFYLKPALSQHIRTRILLRF